MQFSSEWDFEHHPSSPRHSQGNGKAESAVKEAKKILMKTKKAGSDAFMALLDHRNTPSSSTMTSPTQRLMNRRTRSLLPMSAGLLKPNAPHDGHTQDKVRHRQQKQAHYYNRGARDLDPLEPGDPVRIKPWQLGKKGWEEGLVRSRLDERSYEVQAPQGVLRRNRVHLRKSEPTTEPRQGHATPRHMTRLMKYHMSWRRVNPHSAPPLR